MRDVIVSCCLVTDPSSFRVCVSRITTSRPSSSSLTPTLFLPLSLSHTLLRSNLSLRNFLPSPEKQSTNEMMLNNMKCTSDRDAKEKEKKSAVCLVSDKNNSREQPEVSQKIPNKRHTVQTHIQRPVAAGRFNLLVVFGLPPPPAIAWGFLQRTKAKQVESGCGSARKGVGVGKGRRR